MFIRSSHLLSPFHCYGSTVPIAYDKSLRNIMHWFDGVVIGNVATSLNGIFYGAARTDMSYYFIDCVVACAIFGWSLPGCVRIPATVRCTHVINDASQSWVF